MYVFAQYAEQRLFSAQDYRRKDLKKFQSSKLIHNKHSLHFVRHFSLLLSLLIFYFRSQYTLLPLCAPKIIHTLAAILESYIQ